MKTSRRICYGAIVVLLSALSFLMASSAEPRGPSTRAPTVAPQSKATKEDSGAKVGRLSSPRPKRDETIKVKVKEDGDEPAKPVEAWPWLAPLTPSEESEFQVVLEQVDRYMQWGEMSPRDVEAFRAALWRLGDRATAHIARRLAKLGHGAVKNSREADKVIQQIDALSYLAAASRPIAVDAIRTLATRPVEWDNEGALVDKQQATVTFEAFDVFAKVKPGEALAHILAVSPEYRQPYVVHYVYGRRLAGLEEAAIHQELAAQPDLEVLNAEFQL